MATRTTKTTSKSKTTRSSSSRTTRAAAKPKTAPKAKTAAKAATPKTKKVAPVVVDAPKPVISGPVMKKKELIDAAVERSGMKRKDAKPAIEAALAVLGEALREGRELNLQPLGKVKVTREKKLASGHMMVVRVRQSDRSTAEQAPATDSSKPTDQAAE